MNRHINYLGDYMFNKITDYLNNKEIKITLFDGKINILNYEKLISIEPEHVSVRYKNKIIRIKGKELLLKKILDNELLIMGIIKTIEVLDE